MLTRLYTVVWLAVAHGCYWNAQCPYQLFGSKTPYETVRGDIRDYPLPANCEPVSLWTFMRHGNRYPSTREINPMKNVSLLKETIISVHEAGGGELCAQDIEDLKNWSWDPAIDYYTLNLTSTGFTELSNLGKRIRNKYSKLLNTTSEEFYFKSAADPRATQSGEAFIKGFTGGAEDIRMEESVEGDEILKPYELCERYQTVEDHGPRLQSIKDQYYTSPEVLAIAKAVEKRIGISDQLDGRSIYSLYQLCRFYRTWSATHRSPWCALFSTEDLIVLEYHDDLKRYYKNSHGSWVNIKLGRMILKSWYKHFKSVTQGSGKKMMALFSHATLMEMTLAALGLYKDPTDLQSNYVDADPHRLWRTSYVSPICGNFITILNRCNETNKQVYKVQVFLHEKPTPLCPLEGCPWEQFEAIVKPHVNATLDFCSLDYVHKGPESVPNSAGNVKPFWSM